MHDTKMAVIEIQERANASLKGGFPYAEYRSVSRYSSDPESLNPDIDYFLSNVAGFALSPATIPNRSRKEIALGIGLLQQNFFLRHPQHAAVAPHITSSTTPHLYAELNAAEALRPHNFRMLLEARATQGTKGITA